MFQSEQDSITGETRLRSELFCISVIIQNYINCVPYLSNILEVDYRDLKKLFNICSDEKLHAHISEVKRDLLASCTADIASDIDYLKLMSYVYENECRA